MTRDEIVTALRCCAGDSCEGCPYDEIFAVEDAKCIEKATGYAADLIENQQRHIEALMKANDSLKDAIARRDKQIEDMKQGMAQLAKAVAVKEDNNGTTYEDTGLTPKRCAEFAQADAEGRYIVMRDAEQEGIDRLRELAEADKDGRLVVLPCKMGDTVYWVHGAVITE